MGWNWVTDLFAPNGKKKSHDWNMRCQYGLCPGNQPLNRHQVIYNKEEPLLRPAKLKFVQVISPMVNQYRCGYCGCLQNISSEVPVNGFEFNSINPAMWGGKPDFLLKR